MSSICNVSDGKFILELVRGVAREGGGGGWVSVPRKTFWPPAAAPGTPPGAPPPSAALSVSDDNSSVQSSPWQRDHCWKQAAPRKNLSKELALYYCRPSTLSVAAIDAVSRVKRRRPFDTSHHDMPNGTSTSARRPINGIKNGDAASPRAEDTVDSVAPRSKPDDDREIYYHMKLKKPYQYRKLRVYKKTRPALRRKLLARTVNKLLERAPSIPAPVNAKLAHCRQEHAIVSPRKRILRELERVSLEDHGSKRRAKTAPALSTASYPPSPGPSHAPPAPRPAPPAPIPPASKHVSSYSIHSLLSMPDDSPTRRSPETKRERELSYPPSLKTESPSSVTSPDLSPSPDGYRYRYAGTSGSPGQGVARDSPTPPHYRAPYAPAPASPYGRAWASTYRGSPARDEWVRDVPYVYGYGYMPAHVYRAPPAPLWMHYAVPPAPSPWAPLALPLLTDHIPKDEPTSGEIPIFI